MKCKPTSPDLHPHPISLWGSHTQAPSHQTPRDSASAQSPGLAGLSGACPEPVLSPLAPPACPFWESLPLLLTCPVLPQWKPSPDPMALPHLKCSVTTLYFRIVFHSVTHPACFPRWLHHLRSGPTTLQQGRESGSMSHGL